MDQARRRRTPARVTGALTALALAAAVAVPVGLWPGGGTGASSTIEGAAANALLRAPADQIRAREWHLTTIRAARAWRYARGAGVTVAVLDTGVDGRHPDLAGRVLSGPDLTGGKRRPGSRYWGQHGTSMASIIAGHGNGTGGRRGVIGVAPLSRILSIRVTWENDDPVRRAGRSGLSRDTVAQGIRYAVDHGAQVVNMSLGGGQLYGNGSRAEESAIKYALSRNVVLIASAGNDGATGNRRNFPAAYPGVIAVGALDQHGRLWKDSNHRPYVGVCAPGVEIVSAGPGSGYVVGSGTSPSSAIVAGVAALIRSRYPSLTPPQIKQALVQGSPARAGQPTGSPTCAGPLDAGRAMRAAGALNRASGGKVTTPPPTASPASPKTTSSAGSSPLLRAILVGGGVLVLIGVVLGWRGRRRPEQAPPTPPTPTEPPALPRRPKPNNSTPPNPHPAPHTPQHEPREPTRPGDPTAPREPAEPRKPVPSREPAAPHEPAPPGAPRAPRGPAAPGAPRAPRGPAAPREPAAPGAPFASREPAAPREAAAPRTPFTSGEAAAPREPVPPGAPPAPAAPGAPLAPRGPAAPRVPPTPHAPGPAREAAESREPVASRDPAVPTVPGGPREAGVSGGRFGDGEKAPVDVTFEAAGVRGEDDDEYTGPVFDDDEWERFRQRALREPFLPDEDDEPAGRPEPATPPEEPPGASVPRDAEQDDEYRPPWW
ncbi:Thermophilic serine proteinase precursor [Actinomadura rubteroloni]|uniref:Thermophilic serine proteinase n=1 Tax=Actinomadura rubteroloni TaxID=1926885 RepID=A0A2P4UKQ3_9ACTN|nr:S8 family serine peptidase [Actinomadura rubteroloni]POM25635.1 Thermophilic serine proteinase precursor [Actinomadura rubteroloni]